MSSKFVFRAGLSAARSGAERCVAVCVQLCVLRFVARGAAAALGLVLISLAALPGLETPLAAQEKPAPEAAKSSDEALRAYGRAVRLHNNAAYEVAAEEWAAFLKDHPADPLAGKARYYLGICHLQQRELEKAAATFAEVVKNPKFELFEDAQFNLGWVQFTMAEAGEGKLYPTAATTFAELVKLAPQGKRADQALYYQGECLYAQGKREEAAALYGRLAAEHPKSTLRCLALYAQGVALEETQKYAEAGKVYDTFLTDCADNKLATEVQMRKAETILQAGDAAQADAMFGAAAAVEGFAMADHALYRQAFCRSQQEKLAEAAALYVKLCEQYPKTNYLDEATMAAARCFYRAPAPEQAAVWLAKVIQAGGGDAPEAAHWQCRLHLADSKPAEAAKLAAQFLPVAEKAKSEFLVHLKMDQADAAYAAPAQRAEGVALYLAIADQEADSPLKSQALYYAAFGNFELEKYPEGLALATRFLKAYPSDPLLVDVQYVSAECHLHLKQYEEAAKEFAALATHAEHPDYQLWLLRHSLALYLQKKYPEASAAATAALPKLTEPAGKAEALYLVGASAFYQDQFQPGVEALEASLAADAKWHKADEALLLLSRCHHKLKQLDPALAAVTRLLQEFPKSSQITEAHYRHGEYSYDKQDYKTAAAQFELCLKTGAGTEFEPFAHYNRGWSQLKLGEFEPAVASFSEVISKHAEHSLAPSSLFARALAHRSGGKHAETLADVAAFLKTDPPVDKVCEALYEQGMSQTALKQPQEAAATFDDILKRDPKFVGAAAVLYELGWARLALQDNAAAMAAFSKLADEHSADPLAAEASYHVAQGLYDAKDYAAAVKRYVFARDKSDPKTELHEKALFKLGWSHFQLEEFAPANEQFVKQTAEHPTGSLFGDGTLMKGLTFFKQDKFAEALPAFLAAEKAKLSSPLLEVLARLRGGQSASQLKQWQQSFDLLDQIPAAHPDTPYLAEVYYERGWAQQNLSKNEAALKDYKEAAQRGQGEVAARARFMSGELLFAGKKYDEAVKEFQRVMFVFENSDDAKIQNWQAKAGYEAGRCADVQIMDAPQEKKAEHIADAKKFYSYVVEKHPQHELSAAAKKRLAELAKL